MRLFRKYYSPQEVGAILYESVRAAVASPSGDLSLSLFLERLGVTASELPDQHVGEIVAGALFAASLAAERSVSRWLAGEILRGMRTEFLRHIKEQGALPEQVDEWERVLYARSEEYSAELRTYDELEPPWKLGRRFLWKVKGIEEYNALAIKHATQYLLAVRDRAQETLNAYGPHIRIVPPA